MAEKRDFLESQVDYFGFTTQPQINQKKPENFKAKSYFKTGWLMRSEGLTPRAECKDINII